MTHGSILAFFGDAQAAQAAYGNLQRQGYTQIALITRPAGERESEKNNVAQPRVVRPKIAAHRRRGRRRHDRREFGDRRRPFGRGAARDSTGVSNRGRDCWRRHRLRLERPRRGALARRHAQSLSQFGDGRRNFGYRARAVQSTAKARWRLCARAKAAPPSFWSATRPTRSTSPKRRCAATF